MVSTLDAESMEVGGPIGDEMGSGQLKRSRLKDADICGVSCACSSPSPARLGHEAVP